MPAHNFIDLTGQRFERLVVQERSPNAKNRAAQWRCLCDCGKMSTALTYELRHKIKRSCGCLRDEMTRQRFTKHGKRGMPEYLIYHGIKRRCTDPKMQNYSYYGGRGITLEWQTFEEFFQDVGPRPTPEHTIERRDNDGPYSKDNCFWATRIEQANNKRNNHIVEFNGQRVTFRQVATITGLTYSAVKWRVKHGKPLDAPHRRSLTRRKSF